MSLRRRLRKTRSHLAIAGVDPAQALLGEIVKASAAQGREGVLRRVGDVHDGHVVAHGEVREQRHIACRQPLKIADQQ